MSETRIRLAAGTDVGLVRKNNEDNFVVNGNLVENNWIIPNSSELLSLGEWGCLLVVADGMGGMNAGEVASSIAIETIQERFSPKELKKFFSDGDVTLSDSKICKFMTDAIKSADLKIVNRSKIDSSTQGMGTTIVMLWLLDEMAYISWCGDSRCYVFNAESGISRLSKDHSFVQELVDAGKLEPENVFEHPYSNIITRCLGDTENRANPDFRSFQFKSGDTFLLCSDGLCGLCTDEEIMQIMLEHKESLADCKTALIEAAIAAGGYDNVTVGMCQVAKVLQQEATELENTLFSKPVKKSRSLFYILIILIVLSVLLYVFFPDEVLSFTKRIPGL